MLHKASVTTGAFFYMLSTWKGQECPYDYYLGQNLTIQLFVDHLHPRFDLLLNSFNMVQQQHPLKPIGSVSLHEGLRKLPKSHGVHA